jgi:hypothetical protein
MTSLWFEGAHRIIDERHAEERIAERLVCLEPQRRQIAAAAHFVGDPGGRPAPRADEAMDVRIREYHWTKMDGVDVAPVVDFVEPRVDRFEMVPRVGFEVDARPRLVSTVPFVLQKPVACRVQDAIGRRVAHVEVVAVRRRRDARDDVARHDRVEPQSRGLQQIHRVNLSIGRPYVAEDALKEVVVRGNRVVLRGLRLHARPFVVAEEKQAVPYDRSSQVAAELIALRLGLWKAVPFVEERIRRPRGAVVEPEQIAGEPIGSRRRNHPHVCCATGQVGARASRCNGEFADRLRRRPVRTEIERVGTDEVVLNIDAVLRDLRPRRTPAVDGGLRAIGDSRHAGLEANQRERIAIVEWQLRDLPPDDGLCHFWGGRRHVRPRDGHVNRLRQRTHVHSSCERALDADIDVDVLKLRRAKSRQHHRHGVDARLDLGKEERTGLAGGRGLDLAGLIVRQRDGDTRKDAATRVQYRSREPAEGALCGCDRAEHDERDQRAEQVPERDAYRRRQRLGP